jgi:hypothetical protein
MRFDSRTVHDLVLKSRADLPGVGGDAATCALARAT